MAKGGASCGFFLKCAPWSRPKHWSGLSSGLRNWPHQSKANHVASRAQITRLAQRIEALATRSTPPGHPEPPAEHWFVDGDKAWLRETPQQVITWAELEARPTASIVIRYVHADNGRPAACCSVGGACYAVHGPTNSV